MNTRESRRISNMKYARIYITSSLYKAPLKYEKALAYLIVNLNISRRTAKEMIDSLIGIDEYRLDQDNLVFPINTIEEKIRTLTHSVVSDILTAKPAEETKGELEGANTSETIGDTPTNSL